jgi:hypothetical protein
MDDKYKMFVSELHMNQPVNIEYLKNVEEYFKITFPKQYVDFMLTTNGAEGDVGDNSYLVLWSAEEIIELNKEYEVNEFALGLILFGSNGGMDAYAFDTRRENLPIIEVPFIGMALEEIKDCGDTLLDFFKYLYNHN